MKKHRLIVLAVILILGILTAASLQNWKSEAMSQDSEKQSKPLTWILFALGKDYDCFFTIEDGWNESEPGNRLEAVWSERTLKKVGLVRELEQLRQSVPNFSYEFNPMNSRIVHIIDARLKQQKGYALEATIKNIDFTGMVNSLPTEIGKQGLSISAPTGRFTHEQWDGSTLVEVKGEGLSVRGALSNFVEMEGRGRILWVARIRLEPGAVSHVFYPWPGTLNKQR